MELSIQIDDEFPAHWVVIKFEGETLTVACSSKVSPQALSALRRDLGAEVVGAIERLGPPVTPV